MILAPLLAFVLVPLASLVKAQDIIDFEDGIHNVTSIVGTWSSQSRSVMTGPVSRVCLFPDTMLTSARRIS
jgi:hypothetical protein